MRVLQGAGQGRLSTLEPSVATGTQGLAGWVLGLLRDWRSGREVQQKQLLLVESLPLGGKRQLMLVTCGEESFLVGGGPESVQAIVRLNAKASLDAVSKSVDKTCE
jgi:flagellar biogenesis protein FliO